jgi:UDP-glucose 4-epimerase
MTTTVAVLGGGGFIGSWVTDHLLSEGYTVRVFERPGILPYRNFNAQRAEWIMGDISRIDKIQQAIDGACAVVHLVSTTLPKTSNDDPVYDVESNLVPTLNLLRAMVDQHIPKIIFISSGGTIYGTPQYIPIEESHPTNPLVSYGIVKLAIEKYISVFSKFYELNGIILRVANPFGERQMAGTGQGAVAVFLHRALSGLTIDIWGDGSCRRDYLHVSDVAQAVSKAVRYDGPAGVFNISSGKGTSVNELLHELEFVLGMRIPRRYLPNRPIDVPVSVLSNSLAGKELSWAPAVSLRDGLLRTTEWMKWRLEVADLAVKSDAAVASGA